MALRARPQLPWKMPPQRLKRATVWERGHTRPTVFEAGARYRYPERRLRRSTLYMSCERLAREANLLRSTTAMPAPTSS
eukprot:scaffold2910_cov390-Prasinococcus_capsulatus_cf.AAC.66